MSYKYFLISVFLLFNCFVNAQKAVEVSPPDYIKTIIFKSNTNESQLPIFRLNDKLVLKFDVLNGDEADFYYEINSFQDRITRKRNLFSRRI